MTTMQAEVLEVRTLKDLHGTPMLLAIVRCPVLGCRGRHKHQLVHIDHPQSLALSRSFCPQTGVSYTSNLALNDIQAPLARLVQALTVFGTQYDPGDDQHAVPVHVVSLLWLVDPASGAEPLTYPVGVGFEDVASEHGKAVRFRHPSPGEDRSERNRGSDREGSSRRLAIPCSSRHR